MVAMFSYTALLNSSPVNCTLAIACIRHVVACEVGLILCHRLPAVCFQEHKPV